MYHLLHLTVLNLAVQLIYLRRMALQWIAAVLWAPDQFCYFVSYFPLIFTFLVHNASAIVSYDRKWVLDIRTAITNLDFYFNESGAQDILLILTRP